MVLQDIRELESDKAITEEAASNVERVEALKILSDTLVLPPGRVNVHERLFAADILNSFWSEIPCTHRVDVANRFVEFRELPLILIRTMVTDEFAVAQPFLENMKTLLDGVLIEACDISRDHRLAIARRSDLSTHVIDKIVMHDDIDAITAILKNKDIMLSLEAVENIVLKARHEISLQTLLLARSEFNLSHGFAMFWWVGPELRRTILSRFAMDRLFLQEAMHPLFIRRANVSDFDPLIEDMLKLVDRRESPRGRNGEKISQDILEHTLELAFGSTETVFIEAIALLAGIKEITAERILKDMGGEAYAILCKSLGVPRRRFAEYLVEAAARKMVGFDLSFENQAFLQETFDLIGRDYARTIIRYWDWRSGDLVSRSEIPSLY